MSDNDKAAWVKRVLSIDVNGPLAPEGLSDADLAELGLDRLDLWSAARRAFEDAAEDVDAQILQLQAALRGSDDEDFQEIADAGLNGITGNTRVPLIAALGSTGSSVASIRQATPILRKAIGAFRSHLASEPRIAACDDNPLEVTVSIRATYEAALDQLEESLNHVVRASA